MKVKNLKILKKKQDMDHFNKKNLIILLNYNIFKKISIIKNRNLNKYLINQVQMK